jgi:hypothetical protein
MSATIEHQFSSIDREGGDPSVYLPGEESKFGVNIANTTPYYNMILCESLANSKELEFTKVMRKISTRHHENRKDKLASTLFNTFKGKSLLEGLDMIKFKSVKDLFDLAMQMSIETQ